MNRLQPKVQKVTRKAPRSVSVLVILMLVVATMAPFLPPYVLNVVVLSLIFSIAAVGLDILMGYTGLDSLGQAAYFGCAAYIVSILTITYQVNWLLAAAIAIVASTLLGSLLGLLAVRLGGLYFLLITLAFGQVLWGGAQRWGSLTGGFNGLGGVPPPLQMFASPLNFCWLVICIFLLVVLVAKLITSSTFGLGLKGVREDELRMKTLGHKTFLLKWIAFAIAALFAALAGVLGATFNSFVSPSDLSLQFSFALMLMVIIGGAGYIYGAVVGAIIVTALQLELSVYLPDYWVLVLGLVYAVTAISLPNGVVGKIHSRNLLNRQVAKDEVFSQDATSKIFVRAERELKPSVALAAGTEVLSLLNIKKTFGGFTAVDSVSLSIVQGERTAIIGPNGAGKTTLFNLVSGLMPVTGGEIVINGTNLTGRPINARPKTGLGRTFQVTRVFGPRTVLENMILAMLGYSHSGSAFDMAHTLGQNHALKDEAMYQLSRVGLESEAEETVSSLSYGHQKQLDIGFALASNPTLLLLDEPTAGLSQTESKKMIELIVQLPGEVSVLIIEHNLDVVFSTTDRLVVLDHGQIIEDGPQSEVRRSEEVRRIYFGSRA